MYLHRHRSECRFCFSCKSCSLWTRSAGSHLNRPCRTHTSWRSLFPPLSEWRRSLILLEPEARRLVRKTAVQQLFLTSHVRECNQMCYCPRSVFAGCQIPYPKREFLTEEEPEDKADKVRKFWHFKGWNHRTILGENIVNANAMPVFPSILVFSLMLSFHAMFYWPLLGFKCDDTVTCWARDCRIESRLMQVVGKSQHFKKSACLSVRMKWSAFKLSLSLCIIMLIEMAV